MMPCIPYLSYLPYLSYIPHIPYFPNMPYQTDHTHHTYHTTPPPHHGGEGDSATPPPHHRGGGGRSHMGPVYGTHPMGGEGRGGWQGLVHIYYSFDPMGLFLLVITSTRRSHEPGWEVYNERVEACPQLLGYVQRTLPLRPIHQDRCKKGFQQQRNGNVAFGFRNGSKWGLTPFLTGVNLETIRKPCF